MFKRNGLLLLLATYLLSAIAYAISPLSRPEVIGVITLVGEVGMDILIFILALQLYYAVSGRNRYLFGIIAFSYFCESFADGVYNLTQNVLNVSNPSLLLSSAFEIPFLSFLCLQAWVWWQLFSEANSNSKPDKKPMLVYGSFIASLLLMIVTFVYFADWKIDRFSGEGLYQLADVLAEAAGFALVSIYLGTSRNKYFSCIAIGFLIIVCSNYMIRLPVISLGSKQNSPFEFTWILGQLLVFYGHTRFKQTYIKSLSGKWCYGLNCLQSQIAVGSFSLGLLAIALFSIFMKYAAVSGSSDNDQLEYLPVVTILFSVITFY